MKTLVTIFGSLTLFLTSNICMALPTTFEKLDCAKTYLTEELAKSGYLLNLKSLDIKESYNPINVVYIGTDILALINGRGIQGTDVEFIAFEATKSDVVTSGWMYLISIVNIDGNSKHHCTVGKQGNKSSIALGKIVLGDQ